MNTALNFVNNYILIIYFQLLRRTDAVLLHN